MKNLYKKFIRRVIEEHVVETKYYSYLHHAVCDFEYAGHCDRLILNEELEVVGYEEG